MNTIDFTNYKFRSSSLPNLMVKSRSKSDPLSETTKAYLRELWIKEMFKREKYDTKNKFTDKGIACESDSLDLVQIVTKQTYFKNRKELSNDFITGTPDVILEDSIIDIKTSWDIWTYGSTTEDSARKTYYYQLLGYMWLTNTKKASLMYCLVNTPEDIMNDELYRLSFRYPEINESDEKANKYKRNYIFDDIDHTLRLKKYDFEFVEEDINELQNKIVLAREYMNGLSL